MALTTLYNKWRPRTFADPRDRPLVGQEPVARTLRQAILRQQVAHAYLFCGPRGTGKTSAARIFARAINCLAGLQGEPCNRCANCAALLDGRQLDLLIEIDAASNRGVEDARTLRDRLLQRPGGDGLTGRYKVYIIDEVHMLTKEAFNTLLKSLEEPPPHVIFVLATTDPQEILPTILSRCQRFDFRPISIEQLVAHLAHIASEEGVAVETRALETLARGARGGLRDAIGLLDQAFAYIGAGGDGRARQLSGVQVDAMLGLSRTDAIAEMVRAIGDADLASVLRATHAALDGGADVRALARQVVEALRAILLIIGGVPEVVDVEPGLRDAVALHARRFTLGRTIRAIKTLAALDAGLRTRTGDAALLFEVAVAEIVSEAAGTATATVRTATTAVTPPTFSGQQPVVLSAQLTEASTPPPPLNATPSTAPVRTEPVASATPGQSRPRPTKEIDPKTSGDEDGRLDARAARILVQTERPDGLAETSESVETARLEVAPPSRDEESEAHRQEHSEPREQVGLVSTVPVPDDVRRAAGGSTSASGGGSWPTSPSQGRGGAQRETARRRTTSTKPIDLGEAIAHWASVIERVGADGMVPIVGLLQGSVPSGLDPDGALAVSCGSNFFVQKLREPANQVGIERCASQVLGVPVRLRFHVTGTVSDGSSRRSHTVGAQDAFVARAARLLGGRALDPEEIAQLDRQAPLPLDGLPD